MLAQWPSFGRNPRGSPDFLAYPVQKAGLRRVLGTWVPRCLAVARFASSPKAALAFRMQPYLRSPDLVLPGHLHGTGCLSVRAIDTTYSTAVWRATFGFELVLSWPLPAWD